VHVNAETTDNGRVRYRSCSNLSVLVTGRGVIAGKYIVVIINLYYIVIVRAFIIIMEQLNETARQTIIKMSTARLVLKLVQLGYDENALEGKERKDLLQLYAQAVADGKEAARANPIPPIETKIVYDVEVEKLRISTEMQRHEDFMALEKQKLVVEQQRIETQAAIEQQRLATEREARNRQMDIEGEARNRQMEIEGAARDRQLALEHERLRLKQEALDFQRTRDNTRDTQEYERRNTMAARTKLFAQSLQNVMPKMSNDAVQLVTFFDTVEKLFNNFVVPHDLQAILLNPHLTATARSMLSRMDQTKVNDFNEVKDFLLTQFKLTPQTYRTRFNNTIKQQDETHVLYANKLHLLLQHYIRARNIDKDFERLISCLVSDRLRSSVTDNNCLRHICSLETSSKDGWLDYIDLAMAIDSYYANYTDKGVPLNATAMTGQVQVASRPGTGNSFRLGNTLSRSAPTTDQRTGDNSIHRPNVTSYRLTAQDEQVGQRRSADSLTAMDGRIRHCWTCGATNHKASECSQRYDRQQTTDIGLQGRKPTTSSSQPTDAQRKPARVYRASIHNTTTGKTNTAGVSRQASNVAPEDFKLDLRSTVNTQDTLPKETFALSRVTIQTNQSDKNTPIVPKDIVCKPSENLQTVIKFNENKALINPDFSPLQYINVEIESLPHCVLGLYDSGAETCLANSNIFTEEMHNVTFVGHIKIKPIIGPAIEADLIKINIRLANNDTMQYIPIHCAVSPKVNDRLVLTADVVQRLAKANGHITRRNSENSEIADLPIDYRESRDDAQDHDDSVTKESEVLSMNDYLFSTDAMSITNNTNTTQLDQKTIDTDIINSDRFRQEQKGDKTLLTCWRQARQNKGNFFILNELLYHQENILGQTVHQLVVPETRVRQLMEITHNLTHSSGRRLKMRLRFSFYFPGMRKLCNAFVQQCDSCQRKSRITYRDKTPITAIKRTLLPFSSIHVDIFRPLASPPLAHNYCLIAVDNHSRYPFAIPLKHVTAKTVCDALIDIFSHTSLPTTISSDNGSVFVSKLNQEFLKRLNISPIFITPGHASANALAERHIGSLKSMINRAVHQYPQKWTKVLPMILWFLRETPCQTTGIAPWTLCHGILPKGIVEMVKHNWSNEALLPQDLTQSPSDYLTELQNNLTIARELADETSKRMQDKYVHYYNLRTRDKSFVIGQKVLILIPDSTNKAFAQWQGPATVVDKKAPYSYIVELNGARRHLHADKLRPYHTSIAAITCSATSFIRADCTCHGCLSHHNDCTTKPYISGQHAAYNFENSHLSRVTYVPSRFEFNDSIGINHVQMSCVNGCAVVSENDSEFGHLEFVDTERLSADQPRPLPSQLLDLNTLSHLSKTQRHQLLSLIDRYPGCFTDTPGFCDLFTHTMNMSSEFRPKKFKAYRVPEKLKPALSAEIQKLLNLGFIERIESPQASPIICIMKGKSLDKGIRVVTDYRYVNRYTEDSHQPLECIPDLIHKIGQATYISKFDAKAGYWQTPIEPTQKWINAFICDEGQFAWTRTPFGLKAAGHTFVKAMRKVLQPVREFTANYVDDSAVYSDEWSLHLKHLELFLIEIKKSGFTFNIQKCLFAQPELTFAGCVVGSGKHRADLNKVATIQNMKRPETKKEIRQMLGFFAHFSSYIPSYAGIAKCLTDLTSKRFPNRINWSQQHEDAFTTLKRLLYEAATVPLFIIDYNIPFNISVDASNHAVGAILSQTDEHVMEKPIAFTSQKLTESQSQSWSTIEKEAYAVIHSLNKFRDWIFLSKVNIYSDHNPLQYLTEAAPKSSKLTRWALALQEFDIMFYYRPGKLNFPADFLSRINLDQ
jgi:transposase InsO family protein